MELILLIIALFVIITTPFITFKYGVRYAFFPAFVVGAILFSSLMHANYGAGGIPMALVYAGQLFTFSINGRDLFELSTAISCENKTLFMICIWGIYVVCPFITITAIIKFIKTRFEKLRLWFKFKKKIYVFSAKTPESLALASDIRKNNKKAVIVFSCEPGEKEIKKEIDINRSPQKIFAQINGTNEVHMCFIDENDDIALDKLTDFLTGKKKTLAEVYVFTENDTCEEVIDTLKIKYPSAHIRTADMRAATVRNILWDYPLFLNRKTKHMLNVTVIGVGAFGGCFASKPFGAESCLIAA